MKDTEKFKKAIQELRRQHDPEFEKFEEAADALGTEIMEVIDKHTTALDPELNGSRVVAVALMDVMYGVLSQCTCSSCRRAIREGWNRAMPSLIRDAMTEAAKTHPADSEHLH